MAAILVYFASREGQTEKVAGRIVDALTERGHDATAVSAGNELPDFDVADFDAALVGASIHVGRHQPEVIEFVRNNSATLARMPTAFFQISLSSATEEGRAQAAGYVEEFVEETGWHPDRIGLFGGALRYSEYGFLQRLLMKQMVKRTMPDVEAVNEDAEFTDWHEVEAFAADVAAFVEGRLGVAPPAGTAGDE